MKNLYELRDDHAVVFCNRKGNRVEVLVDIKSLPVMQSYPGTWGIDEDHNGRMYCKMELNKPGMQRVYLHKLLTDCPKGLIADHLDGNSLNNRLYNLEVTTQRRNVRNMSKYSSNTSGFRGVSYKASNKKWAAYVDRKELGLYDCKYEAARVATAYRLQAGLPVDRVPIKL